METSATQEIEPEQHLKRTAERLETMRAAMKQTDQSNCSISRTTGYGGKLLSSRNSSYHHPQT
jgi:hypothetical protein